MRSKAQAIADHVRRIREVDPGTEQALRDRNIAVHRYHELDLRVLRSILDSRLPDLIHFAELGIQLAASPGTP